MTIITVIAARGPSLTSIINVQCVSDGDTATAIAANATKPRVLGIDAPEIRHDDKPDRSCGEGTQDDHELAQQVMETVDA